jgi:flagellar basal body P-ring formation protein FlgA
MKDKALKIFVLILVILPMWITLIYAEASTAQASTTETSMFDSWKSVANEALLKIEEPKVQISKIISASEVFDPSLKAAQVKVDISQVSDRKNSEIALSFESAEGQLLKHVRLSVEAIVQKKLAVATRSMKRGEALTDADVRWEWREAKNIPMHSIVGQIPQGTTLRTNLQQGDAILSNRLEIELAVRRGEQVSIRVVAPGIMITGKGVAQESGRLGQMIRILNLDSKREVFGTVTGTEVVEVRL